METPLTHHASRKAAANHENNVERISQGRVRVIPGQVWLGDGSTPNKHATPAEQKLTYGCYVNPEHPNWEARPSSILQGRGCPACKHQAARDSWGKVRKPRASEAEKQKARDLRAQGLTQQQIADQLGRSLFSIQRWCDPEQAERHRLKNAEYQEENRKAINASNRRWAQQTPHGRANHSTANAMRRGEYRTYDDEGNLTYQEWERLGPKDQAALEAIEARLAELNRTNYMDTQWSLEHLLPLSKGGEHAPWNLSITPLADNISKGDKLVPEHLALRVHKINQMFKEDQRP